jgi:hypothetical protein
MNMSWASDDSMCDDDGNEEASMYDSSLEFSHEID